MSNIIYRTLLTIAICTSAASLVCAGDNITYQQKAMPPMNLLLESVDKISLESYYPYYILSLAADYDGGIHLFTAPGPHAFDEGEQSYAISHYRLSAGGIRLVGSISAGRRPVLFAKSALGNNGILSLVWAEASEGYPRNEASRIYHSNWDGTAWSAATLISDELARPGVSGSGDMDFVTSQDGGVEFFWIDWRERHFWRSLFKRGEGDYPKSFHRTLTTRGISNVQRMQRRGSFSVHSIGALEQGDVLHSFWSQSKNTNSPNGYSDLFWARRSGNSWSEPKRLSDNRSYDNTPGIVLTITAAPGSAESLAVAWIWSRWESESKKEHILEYRSYQAGRWSETSYVLSQAATHAAWCTGPGGTTGLLVQENGDDRRSDLVFIPFDRLEDGTKKLISKSTLDGMYTSTVSRDGVSHIVYLLADEHGQVRAEYRVW